MKWLPPNGSTQHTADGRYAVVQATSQHWVAYKLTPYGTGEDLGNKPTDADARGLCESHEAELVRRMRRA